MAQEPTELKAARCLTCKNRLTQEEFRASAGVGHYCDEHRPFNPSPRITSRKAVHTGGGSSRDAVMNVALKVTWVYGEQGPFTSPCTPEGRYRNIHDTKKTWCRQPDCPCLKLYDEDSDDQYYEHHDSWPCYDAAIFKRWRFTGGIYHTGYRKGEEIPAFKETAIGKLAFYTSRNIDMPEKDRIIIGCFRIDTMGWDDEFGSFCIGAGDMKLKVKNFKKAPRYWDHHMQNGPPAWGTGLFRYIPDREAKLMLTALEKVSTRVE